MPAPNRAQTRADRLTDYAMAAGPLLSQWGHLSNEAHAELTREFGITVALSKFLAGKCRTRGLLPHVEPGVWSAVNRQPATDTVAAQNRRECVARLTAAAYGYGWARGCLRRLDTLTNALIAWQRLTGQACWIHEGRRYRLDGAGELVIDRLNKEPMRGVQR
jgi:hypothetical protein